MITHVEWIQGLCLQLQPVNTKTFITRTWNWQFWQENIKLWDDIC